jgi:predicted secreted hydrolase
VLHLFCLPSVRLLRALILIAGLAAPACGPQAAPAPGQPASPAAQPATPSVSPARPIALPSDDGPHDAQTEWWYYNGYLASGDGQQFSFHLVMFKRQAQSAGRAGYVGHMAVTDHQRSLFRYSQHVALAQPGALTPGVFDVKAGPVSAAGGGGVDRLMGQAGEYQVDITLRTRKPPVIHGDAGIVGVSPEASSYYYSRTRMAAAGTLTVAGTALAVQGEAWMDHQWGDFSLPGAAGWDWFAVQLDSGEDLMVSVLRDDAGRVLSQYGTLVAPGGETVHLADSDLRIAALQTWVSPDTGAAYPMGWRVELPARALALTLQPVLFGQELDTTATTGKVYWEGAVTVAGEGGAAGRGYVELTGYKERTAH